MWAEASGPFERITPEFFGFSHPVLCPGAAYGTGASRLMSNTRNETVPCDCASKCLYWPVSAKDLVGGSTSAIFGIQRSRFGAELTFFFFFQ